MRRYIRSYRTRKNVYDTSALRTQFIRELNEELSGLLKQYSEQFSKDIQSQIQIALRSIVTGDQPPLPNPNEPGGISSLTQLLSTGVRYLASRPRTSRSEAESTRSITAQAEFRTSRAQQLAEAQAALTRGEKNL